MSIDMIANRWIGRVVVSLMLLCAACNLPSESACPQIEPQYAVQVRFVDLHGGSTIVGPVRGEIRDGEYRDSLRAISFDGETGLPAQFGAGRGRAGTYSLIAVRDGYHAVNRDAIQVPSGSCGVQPEFLNVELIPEG